jgi:hypothetical protein
VTVLGNEGLDLKNLWYNLFVTARAAAETAATRRPAEKPEGMAGRPARRRKVSGNEFDTGLKRGV